VRAASLLEGGIPEGRLLRALVSKYDLGPDFDDWHEMSKIADRLKEARQLLKLPQKEVARQLGVPRTAIS
jgi:Helix-turn-helix